MYWGTAVNIPECRGKAIYAKVPPGTGKKLHPPLRVAAVRGKTQRYPSTAKNYLVALTRGVTAARPPPSPAP